MSVVKAPVGVQRRVGAHLSIAGGYEHGIERAIAIGADALQLFSGSPRVWQRPPMDKMAIARLTDASTTHDVRPLFVHALYLVNLASDNTEIVQKSKDVLIYEMQFNSAIGGSGLIVHLGSHQGRGWAASRDQLAVLIGDIIDAAGVDSPFLIENSAGQNGKLCSDLREIRWLIDTIDRPQVGWCYDTCHGWAAGYTALSADNSAYSTVDKDLFATVDKFHLWKNLQCFHVNGSRDPFGAGRDRHANVGDGLLPTTEIAAVINHPQWQHVPIITEAPGWDGNGPDARNINDIRKLLS
jgi:deoxyribonuclease IV